MEPGFRVKDLFAIPWFFDGCGLLDCLLSCDDSPGPCRRPRWTPWLCRRSPFRCKTQRCCHLPSAHARPPSPFIYVTVHQCLPVVPHLSLSTVNFIQMAFTREMSPSFLTKRAGDWARKPPGGGSICQHSGSCPREPRVELTGPGVRSSTFVQVWHMHTSLATVFERRDQGGGGKSGFD